MPVDPAARWQVVPVPVRAPGKCFTCHGIANGPFIDTRLLHDFYLSNPSLEQDGNVYICSACITGMFEALQLHEGVFDSKLKDAYNAGVSDGVESGRRIVDEFADTYKRIIASGSGVISSGDDISTTYNAEDDRAEQPDSTEDVGTEQQGADDAPKDSEPLDLFAGI